MSRGAIRPARHALRTPCAPHLTPSPARAPSTARRTAARTRGHPGLPATRRRCARGRSTVVGIPLALTDYERTMDWMDAVVARARQGRRDRRRRAPRDGRPRGRRDARRGPPPTCSPSPTASRWSGRCARSATAARRASTAPSSWRATASAPRATGTRDVPLRRPQPGRARPAGAQPAPPLSRACRSSAATRRPFRAARPRRRRDAVVDEINRSGADVVWVGTGQPKQEKWMADMRDAPRRAGPRRASAPRSTSTPACVPAGARPGCRRSGLEWAYRLAHEPRRLWRRYARYNPRFVAGFARQYAAHRRERRRPVASGRACARRLGHRPGPRRAAARPVASPTAGCACSGVDNDPERLDAVRARPHALRGDRRRRSCSSASSPRAAGALRPRGATPPAASDIVITLGTPSFSHIEIDMRDIRSALDDLLPRAAARATR